MKTILAKKTTQILLGVTTVLVALTLSAIAVVSREETPMREPETVLREVAVRTVSPASCRASIVAHGTLQPRWQTTLAAEVGGRVVSLAPELLAGRRVEAGQVLVTIDATDYEASVEMARGELASAELALAEERARAEQARVDWERGGLGSIEASALVLRKPQLAAAEAARRSAAAQLRRAEADVARTRVVAPYGGVVVTRQVSPGDYLAPGSPVATLYADALLEARIPVSERELALLPERMLHDDMSPAGVLLRPAARSGVSWEGHITRVERVVDDTNRWRHLVAELPVDEGMAVRPVPGDFVEARLAGREIDGLLALPEGCLGKRGQIWTVGADGLLAAFPAEIAFKDESSLYVRAPSGQEAFEVVLRPLTSFEVGQRVHPVVEPEVRDER